MNNNASAIARDNGIERAVTHAEQVHEDWGTKAYSFLLVYIKTNPSFMTEDVRYAALGIVPTPPSLRAWGGVIQKALKAGLIRRVRYQNVKNINAHLAIASVWHTV